MSDFTFRTSLTTKYTLTVVLLLLIAMGAVMLTVQYTVQQQFVRQYQNNFQSNMSALEQEFDSRDVFIRRQLSSVGDRLQKDNDFRLYAVVLEQYTKPYLVNYAVEVIDATGLDALMVLDAQGILISSGHYKSDFGSDKSEILHQFRNNEPQPLFTQFRSPSGPLLCLAGIDSIRLGKSTFYLLGGLHINSDKLKQIGRYPASIILQQNGNILASSSDTLPSAGLAGSLQSGLQGTKHLKSAGEHYFIGSFSMPMVTDGEVQELTLFLVDSAEDLRMLLGDLNRRMLYITLAGALLAILLSLWRTRAVTRPLKQLAEKAGNLSLDSLDIDFNIKSRDEVGTLNNAMHQLTTRLRKERLQLAQAEKKAATSEIAREVNHDIKNGFTPIRNVILHWEELAEEQPEALNEIFQERKSTVLESLDYLESLARNYSRLKPEIQEKPVDVHEIIRDLAEDYRLLTDDNVSIASELRADNPSIIADPVQMRRAFENILQNSLEALTEGGEIRVTSENRDDRLLLRWEDTGEGIPQEVQENLFQIPVSTKESGSGIGLSNVKRITEDFGGRLDLSSQTGQGTTIMLEFPVPDHRTESDNLKSQDN